MKKIILLFTINILWCQTNNSELNIGQGLELNDFNDFNVQIFEEEDSDEIGLSPNVIESKVKLALRKNGITPTVEESQNFLVITYNVFNDMTSSGKSLGFSVFIEIKFDRNVYYTASSNAFVIYARTWGLTPYTASLPKGRNSAKEFINEKIIDFVDVFSINLLEQNKN